MWLGTPGKVDEVGTQDGVGGEWWPDPASALVGRASVAVPRMYDPEGGEAAQRRSTAPKCCQYREPQGKPPGGERETGLKESADGFRYHVGRACGCPSNRR